MKPWVLATTVLAAWPLLADETAKSQTQPKPPSQQVSSQPAESPLAAAARRSKRLDGKKRIVITNETLKNAKGHVTTSNIHPQFNPPPITGPGEKELAAAREKEKLANAARAAEAAKLADEEKRKLERRARAAEMAEGAEAAYGETDPAEAARPEEEPAKKPQ